MYTSLEVHLVSCFTRACIVQVTILHNLTLAPTLNSSLHLYLCVAADPCFLFEAGEWPLDPNRRPTEVIRRPTRKRYKSTHSSLCSGMPRYTAIFVLKYPPRPEPTYKREETTNQVNRSGPFMVLQLNFLVTEDFLFPAALPRPVSLSTNFYYGEQKISIH